MSRVDLVVPDLGNFADILVVDVLIKKGDSIEVDAPLVTLETDKASMDVPATAAGTVSEVLLKKGDKVSKGTVIARIETNSAGASAAQPAPGVGNSAGSNGAADGDAQFSAAFDAEELERTVTQPVLSSGSVPSSPPAPAPVAAGPAARSEGPGDTVRMPIPDLSRHDRAEVEFNRSTQLLVLGSGPGGYTAAFRAADLGMRVTLVERWSDLGGVCLNVGCIPSKALLHAAKVIEDAESMGAHGIAFGAPAIDMDKLRSW